MNDRAVSLLEQYDLEVLRTGKGRGAILCETSNGLYIFKEYEGSMEKLEFQNELLKRLKEQGRECVEQIVPTKEGNLIVTDYERTNYFLKTYFEGRECNINDENERMEAVRFLAGIHKDMPVPKDVTFCPRSNVISEFEKHNREMKKVKRFLRDKSQKNGFEIYLMQNYDLFYDRATEATENLKEFFTDLEQEYLDTKRPICHGDFQYHNLIKTEDGFALINFEKCVVDYPVRDLYYFLRKLLEKNNWSTELGEELIYAYNEVSPLCAYDMIQLYYRFAYPEKFWKIVNFYYNNRKVWVPDKVCEKLGKLIQAENERQSFLDHLSEMLLGK
ncbi:MAG: CotS family spore coat protein [Lachnospiraceae bacterium]|nr:CotS family spore coat protein [Lachnospiraceae bacterium]